jgi:hypothetical protein
MAELNEGCAEDGAFLCIDKEGPTSASAADAMTLRRMTEEV